MSDYLGFTPSELKEIASSLGTTQKKVKYYINVLGLACWTKADTIKKIRDFRKD